MASRTSGDRRVPVDDEARRHAGTLLRRARFGAMATLDPSTGAPLASRVSLATAQTGDPIFLISRLSAHFGALEADNRCSLLIGEPGSGDPLAHPRMTLTGRAIMVDGNGSAELRGRFLARHPKALPYADFGDFALWRFKVGRASFIRGFGRAHELERSDLCVQPISELERIEHEAVDHVNRCHPDTVDLLAAKTGADGPGWTLATLDPTGLDMVRGDETARFWFDPPLAGADHLRARLIAAARNARSP